MNEFQSYGRPRNPIARLIVPILIYWGISLTAQIIFTTAYITAHINELMAAYESQEKLQKFMEESIGFILRYSTEVTSAAALIMIPITIYMMRKDYKERQFLPAFQTQWKAPASKYIFAAGFGITAGIAFNNILILSNIRAISQSYQSTSDNLYAAPFVVELIGLGIIVPILEENLYRGVVYKRMCDITSKKRAMIFSAVMFAVLHGNIVQLLYSLFFGMMLCYIYEKFGSLKAAIITHCAANIASVILTETGAYRWIFQTPMRMGIITVLCACLASVCFVWIRGLQDQNPAVSDEK